MTSSWIYWPDFTRNIVSNEHIFNTLRPRQNGRQFPDDNFKCIFLNENIQIAIKFSLKFVTKCLIGMGSDNGLAPKRRQAIIWTNYASVYWRMYASLGLSEWTHIDLCLIESISVNVYEYICIFVISQNGDGKGSLSWHPTTCLPCIINTMTSGNQRNQDISSYAGM